jgi:hypothetical protein
LTRTDLEAIVANRVSCAMCHRRFTGDDAQPVENLFAVLRPGSDGHWQKTCELRLTREINIRCYTEVLVHRFCPTDPPSGAADCGWLAAAHRHAAWLQTRCS